MDEYQLFFGVLTRPAAPPWPKPCPHGLGGRERDPKDSSLHLWGLIDPSPAPG